MTRHADPVAWAEYTVTADTVEPVVMTSGEHSRNRATSLPFITGSALRGALAARWLRANSWYPAPGERARPLGEPERTRFLRVFESGLARFPLLFRDPTPPLSLHRCKNDREHPLIDLADPRHRDPARRLDRKCLEDDPKADPEKVRCPDCCGEIDREKPDASARVNTQVRTRTAISDQGTAAEGMLYAQEELDEAQTFTGTLRVHPDLATDLGEWLPITGPEDDPVRVTVGADRSTSGLVELTITPRTTTGPDLVEGVAKRLADWPGWDRGEVVLTARSPLLLTDAWLRPARRFDPDVLARLLDAPSLGVSSVKVVRYTAARVRSVAGWNPAAGLPKPTDTALVEGSVATLRLDPRPDLDVLAGRLARLETEGVGWRRAEGFGDVSACDSRHLEPYGDER